ncbi:MAG TPA: sugar ABC transporter ATP-binding protein, partial [Kofleriaceae bacterium]|nr:sugar ABC transporter ATP-binding protein [Kofleriaceae bacterium]
MTGPLLSMAGIGKSYPGARVLDGVDLARRAGEVHVLLGANGAGKSTLMKILCGQVAADEGTIELDGAAIRPDSPRAAEQLGILCIHQELNLVPGLTVADNVFLGHEPTRRGLIDAAAMRATTRELLGRLRAQIDPDARVGALSVAEQQLVEIAKALRQRPRVLVMDEPTASLSDREIDALFAVVRQLVADGVAIVFISHRMPEIFAIGHRVTVLRDGRSVGSHPVADVDAAALVRLMVGRAPDLQFPARAASPGEEVLRVEGLAGGRLQPVTLSVRAGEVLGVAGVVGAGRTELLNLIYGAHPKAGGTVSVDSKPQTFRHTSDAIRAGVVLCPEDR